MSPNPNPDPTVYYAVILSAEERDALARVLGRVPPNQGLTDLYHRISNLMPPVTIDAIMRETRSGDVVDVPVVDLYDSIVQIANDTLKTDFPREQDVIGRTYSLVERSTAQDLRGVFDEILRPLAIELVLRLNQGELKL